MTIPPAPPPLHPPRLTVSTRPTEKGALVEATGEVGLQTVPLLRAPLQEAAAQPGAAVIVDLRRVDFIDSSALSLLVEVRKSLISRQRSLSVLLTADGQPERVLKLGHFQTIMRLAHEMDEL